MALTATFVASSAGAASSASQSFNFDCGVADSSKLAVLGLHQVGGTAGKLITAITIDGINCLANVTQGENHAKVWCALPSSSGTVAVNLTYDSAPTRFAWGAWTVTESSGSPTDTQSTFNSTDASRSLSMTIPTGGVGLVSGTRNSGTAITTTNAVEDYDVMNFAQRRVGAHTTTTGAVSPQFADVSSMVGFAFSPALPKSLIFPSSFLPFLVR